MSRPLSLADSRCSVARSLDLLGERWTLLIVREAFWGHTRFAEFRQQLGVAPDVLADRLSKLVSAGVFEIRAYREEGERERGEYVLTEKGRALLPILAALVEWGDDYRPTGFGPATVYADAQTGKELHLTFADADGRQVALDDVRIERGPGSLRP
jgi:DNA-binding HxlR family transcriptional regulator